MKQTNLADLTRKSVKEGKMKKVNRYMAAIVGAVMLSQSIPAGASLSNSVVSVNGSNIPDSIMGKVSYSDTYDPIKWIKPGGDGRNGSGNDPWRNGLVTGNGENGLLDDGAPESGVLIYQNMQFNFPSNDQRETPELASVMDDVKKTLVNGGTPTSDSSLSATKKLTSRAAEWSNNNGMTSGAWKLKNTYTFHPGMQLRMNMNGFENGDETSFYRYTNYETAEIGSVWSDNAGTWERKSFSSREDNVTITSVKSQNDVTEFSMNISIDDISDMSSENKMSGSLEDLRYKKLYKNSNNELYIGSVAHYPNYSNSELKNGGFASIARIIVNGENAKINVTDGIAPIDDRTEEQKSNGVPNETVINVSSTVSGNDYIFNSDPEIVVENAEEIIIIAKSARDKNMGAYDEFAEAKSYTIVDKLIEDTNKAAKKYTNGDVFSYKSALVPHTEKHSEIFGRSTVDFKADDADRALSNEKLIAKAKSEGKNEKNLNLAMLERLYYNGRYANICCSGYQVPRLGGMWTGAWKVEWSGDYTTDANINLQVSGNNIGAMPESSQGYINFVLRTVTDWEINAKQIYGIENAIFAPTRIDGDRAMVVHFNESFPGHIWNSGASWLILPIYEYWQCYGNEQIPIADDVYEMLKITDNTYKMSTQWYSPNETAKKNSTVYNLRNTLGLTDERAQEVLAQGYLDLEKDILFPLLTKICNFYTGLLTPEYYTKGGKAYYEEGKTELADDETYLFAPSYSPENRPKGFGSNSYIHLNAVMDISAARDCFNMAKSIAEKLGETIDTNTLTADIDKWNSYEAKLPPYLYEPTGELKEWAVSDYEETYGHRHISQLYGLWPGYEAENDTELFNAAKTLINTKNTYPSTDNVAGHSWMHKGLIMARAKSADGVKDALLPTVSQEMHYNSMMTAHNTSGNQAYCTDTAITTPSILIESLLYSDSDSVEVFPAIMDDMLKNGGTVTGLKTRSGNDISAVEWNASGVKINISAADTVNVKCGKAFKNVTVNGVETKVVEDATGEPCIRISGDAEIVFTFAELDNGTYTILNGENKLAPENSINNANVISSDAIDNSTKWNLTMKADGTYTIENAEHGRYLVNNGEDVYMKRTAADGESIYWTINENGCLVSTSGKCVYLDYGTYKLGSTGTEFAFRHESTVQGQYSADNIMISSEMDLTQVINPGTRVKFKLETAPAAARKKDFVWKVRTSDNSELTDTKITDGELKVGTDAVSKTLTVTAESQDGACVSNELKVIISDIVQGELNITASEDVFISGWYNNNISDKNTNYSDRNYLQTTNTSVSDKKYTLIKFDIPKLDSSIGDILSSELILNFKEQSEPGNVQYYAYGYDGEWSEEDVTWNSFGGDLYNAGTAVANGEYHYADKQMVFALSENYIRSNAGKTVALIIDSPSAKGVRTYWHSKEAGEELAPTIKIAYKVNTENIKTVSYGPYWAEDVINNQGSSGNVITNEFGNFRNVDEEIKLFFPNAENGAAIGTIKRINGIDNGSSTEWNGNVIKTVTADANGIYTVHILANTNADNRLIEVTNNTTGKSAQTRLSGEESEYSTKNWIKVFNTDLELVKGDNEIKIQAPSGKSAPNFIGLLICGNVAADTEEPTSTPTLLPTSTPDPTPVPTPTLTSAPTAIPAVYEIVKYNAEDNGDGTAIIKNVTVKAEDAKEVKVYIAAFGTDGRLKSVRSANVTKDGESTVETNETVAVTDIVKLLLMRGAEPLADLKKVLLFEEETTRISENFNSDWSFSYGDIDGAEAVDFDDGEWTPVAIPHSFSIPYDLNDNSFYIGYGWYRKTFDVSDEWDNKFISLDFEGVFQVADIYVNGNHVPRSKVYGYENITDTSLPTHEGGYSGFSVDITDYVKVGEDNFVAVKVDNIWQADLTPRGGDHQFSGGIYRDVTLTAVNKAHIDWYGTFVWTPAICNPSYQISENRPDSEYKSDFERNGTGITNTLDDPNVEGEYVTEEELLSNLKNRKSDVEVKAEITNTNDKSVKLYVVNTVKYKDNAVAEFKSETVEFLAGEKKTVTSRSEMLSDIKLWDFENPNLYTVHTVVYTADGTKIDNFDTEFGFRSAQFKLDGFYLNGEKTLLDGANVHQDHGGWADAVTNQGFYRDVKYVKETGFNFIRGSHYPHDPSFAEACDKLGVGFWSEGGLWSIGGFNDNDTVDMKPSDWMRSAYPLNATEDRIKSFEQSCFDMVGSMIRVNRNHPSIIVWSMGNEAFFSNDEVTDDVKVLVSRLRDYAHELDYTRKAGLGGTQRKNLNVLAVCDVAGGNGDGGTAKYTNFYLPHLVAEYSSGKNDRPGVTDFQYGEIKNPLDSTQYILPSKTVMLADGTMAESSSAGLTIWCMYHHGSVGGRPLRIMGLMDYYRIPTARYYLYRNDRTGKTIPNGSIDGTATSIKLEGSTDITLDDNSTGKYIITNDGTCDIQLVATMVDENGTWVNDTRDMEIKVIRGNGVFPTGKSYTFKAGKTIQDGRAAIEFRSYYSGETVIQASIPGTDIVSNKIIVTTVNVNDTREEAEPDGFMEADLSQAVPKLTEPESYGQVDVAYNRQSRADSSAGSMIPLNAIDGDSKSYWQAGETGVQSWWVLLENSYYVEKVKLDMGDSPAAYSIYYQNDNEWVKLADCDGNEKEIDFGGVYTGGIKVEFTGVKPSEYARLYSFNAYGTTFTGYARNSVYISDLTPTQAITNGWNGKTAGINKTIEGKPITIGGTVYEKGLGLHADSEAMYDLNENYSRFTAVIGIDDEVGAYSADGKDGATFKVYATVKNSAGIDTEMLIFDKTLTEAGVAETVDISVEGASRIRLVTDKISNNSKDHTDWANPVLWGVMRDISVSESHNVYASKSTVGTTGYEAYIRVVDKLNTDETYTAKMLFADADGNVLDSITSKTSAQTNKKQIYTISADLIPEACTYVIVEVRNADGEIIGSGIM